MEKVTRGDLPTIAAQLLAKLPQEGTHACVVALKGELGSGKTTFMQALARELGFDATVQSPTYVLMKSYPVSFGRFTKLVHIDAYRLEKPEEFAQLAPQSFLHDPGALVCVEWPERLGNMLPTPDATVEFSSLGTPEDVRLVQIS